MSRKILIVMSDVGGGHRSSAEAIAEAITHLYGDKITVRIVDAWRHHTPWPLNRIADAYPWLVSDGLWLWNLIWRSTDRRVWPTQVVAKILIHLHFVRRSWIKMFRAEAPDLVVTVHPLVNRFSLQVLRNALKTDVPCATVVTDLVTAHPSWFSSQADYCLVPTEAARQRALRYGMPPEKVEVVGQPVGLKFAARVGEKLHIRGKLGLKLNRPAVLMVGGAEGMGPVYATARAVATGVPNAQLVVVAGRNTPLKQRLEATAWEIPTQVYGFVTNMPELMGASDVLVTKAGSATLGEAFIAGLPLIIYSFIPGQEEGNVRYVVEQRAGAYVPDLAQIPVLLQEWFQSGNDTLKQMAVNAGVLGRPEATLIIARRLHRLLTEKEVCHTIPPGVALA